MTRTTLNTTWVRRTTLAFALGGGLALTACAGMSNEGKSTAIGAGVGAVAGQVITGTTGGAAAGAVIGGVIGNEEGKD
jgi:osmotically inducible lipoprotein OsmB